MGAPREELGTPTLVAVVPIPSPGDRQRPGACGGCLASAMPSCASSFTGGAAPAVPLLPIACCMHGQGTSSPQPFPSLGSVFQLLGLIHLVGDTMSYSAGFALLLAVEMQEQDEETGLSMRLWGRIRCWAMGWLAAGHRVAQHPGDASIHRAGGAACRRLLQKVLQLLGICSSGTDRLGSPPGAR